MKTLFITAHILLTMAFCYGQGIKTANYRTAPVTDEALVAVLAKFNILIIDMENAKNNHKVLELIKQKNPRLKLICYSNPAETFYHIGNSRPIQTVWMTEINKKYPDWILKTNKGNDVVFFRGMHMLNMSASCPRYNGQTYSDWIADRLLAEVLSDKIWDGYFGDECSGKWSWLYQGQEEGIDADRSGSRDDDAKLDESWAKGVSGFLRKIRQAKGPDFIIITNKLSLEFLDIVDGKMSEGFSNDYLGGKRDGGWWQCMANAEQTGPYTIFQVKEKDIDFGIASAALLDVYVAVGQDNSKWYPQFDQELGQSGETIITKTFKNGTIKIVPAKKEAVISK